MTEIGNFIVAHWETILGVLLLLLATDGIAGYLPDKWVPYVGAVKRIAQILLTRFGKGVPVILALMLLSGCAGLKLEETAAPMPIPPPPGLSSDGARGIRVEGAGVTVVTEAYDEAGWNGDNTVPTKDAVRDKIETMGGTDTIGWDYTALAAAPGTPVAGKVYRADNDNWDPLNYAGTSDYFVMYTGSAYIGIVDLDGNLLVAGVPYSAITGMQKEIGWTIKDATVDTAIADGAQAAVIPASFNGMNLIDVTCSVADLNSAASGATTVVLRRVRGATAVDMTSTGVTIAYNEYTASDETVDTANDDVATGDKIYVDVNAVTSAVQKGLSCTAVFQTP